MKKEDVRIRPLQGDDSISCLTELLHKAYADLAAMGLRYMASHQSEAVTQERLQRGFPLVAELEGTLIGTATLYPPNPESRCLWYREAGVYSFGQFGVHPDFQGYGIGHRLTSVLNTRRTNGAQGNWLWILPKGPFTYASGMSDLAFASSNMCPGAKPTTEVSSYRNNSSHVSNKNKYPHPR